MRYRWLWSVFSHRQVGPIVLRSHQTPRCSVSPSLPFSDNAHLCSPPHNLLRFRDRFCYSIGQTPETNERQNPPINLCRGVCKEEYNQIKLQWRAYIDRIEAKISTNYNQNPTCSHAAQIAAKHKEIEGLLRKLCRRTNLNLPGTALQQLTSFVVGSKGSSLEGSSLSRASLGKVAKRD